MSAAHRQRAHTRLALAQLVVRASLRDAPTMRAAVALWALRGTTDTCLVCGDAQLRGQFAKTCTACGDCMQGAYVDQLAWEAVWAAAELGGQVELAAVSGLVSRGPFRVLVCVLHGVWMVDAPRLSLRADDLPPRG